MNDSIVRIKKVSCQYPNAKNPVLIIDELNLLRNRIVFVLGPSGAGKSTFLETIGLMNNTLSLASDSLFEFSFNPGERLNAHEIWLSQKKLNRIRRSHLSFIFQTTNLINTLSALENIIITKLIKQFPKNIARNRSREKIQKLFSSDNTETRNGLMNGELLPTQLSGGQRQRIAFLRAIVSEPDLLLADEPTGNLDTHNADIAMELLVEHMKKEGSTAVIVSHDVNLALNYADIIVHVKMEKHENDKSYGRISKEFTYHKLDNKWSVNERIISTELLKNELSYKS